MAKTLEVKVVSAESEIFSGDCKMVFATGMLGEMGIAPEHAPLLTMLRPGEIRLVLADDEEDEFYISGGMLEVQPYQVTVLADTAIRAKDLDESKALEAQKEAQKAMSEKGADFDYSLVESELARATAQLQAIKRYRKRYGK